MLISFAHVGTENRQIYVHTNTYMHAYTHIFRKTISGNWVHARFKNITQLTTIRMM